MTLLDPATLARDTTIVVEDNALLATALAQRGHSVVHIGGPAPPAEYVPTANALLERWSVLTARNPDVAVFALDRSIGAQCDYLAIRTRVNNSTSEFRARGWVEHLLTNLHQLASPCFAACGVSREGGGPVPAFIVGAGASLDDDAPLMAEARKRGIVIGINAGARLPEVHVALTVEGNDLRHKLGGLEHVQARAFALSCNPAVLAHGNAPLIPIFSGELGAVPEQLTGYQRLVSSAIGGTAAIALAARWGCAPIVLLGHDFAYRDGGRVYAECLGLADARIRRDGETWRWDWPDDYRRQPRQNPLPDREPFCNVTGLDGTPVLSTPGLAGSAQWVASFAAKSGIPMVQAASWGHAPAGVRAARLRTVIDELQESDVTLASHAPGVQPQLARYWLGLQLVGLDAVVRAADALAGAPDEARVRMLVESLRRCPLVEPWTHRRVAEVAADRRRGPMSSNSWEERGASLGHAVAIAAVLRDEAPSLRTALETALRAWDEPASDLTDMPLPPGAASDVLRSALRTAAWHGRRPWHQRLVARVGA